MRFITDENIPVALVVALRARGHDVLEARIETPGENDASLLRAGRTDDRVLITRDKDFGTLVYRANHRTAGVILLRVPGIAVAADRIAARIHEDGERWVGRFSVIEVARTRSSPLP